MENNDEWKCNYYVHHWQKDGIWFELLSQRTSSKNACNKSLELKPPQGTGKLAMICL